MEIRTVKRNSDQALYSQLEDIIREEIESGVWVPGQAIPSERQLSEMYSLSRMTVRKALERLVSAGLLYRVDGKGTYVSSPKVSFKALSLAGLRQQMLEMGHVPSARLIEVEKILAPMAHAHALHISVDAPVYQIERVTIANEVPVAIHRSYIPVDLCPGLETFNLANESLYTILKDEYGIRISHATEVLEATLATERESLFLDVPSNSPMLLLRITMFNDKAEPVEYVKVVFRGDKVQLMLDV